MDLKFLFHQKYGHPDSRNHSKKDMAIYSKNNNKKTNESIFLEFPFPNNDYYALKELKFLQALNHHSFEIIVQNKKMYLPLLANGNHPLTNTSIDNYECFCAFGFMVWELLLNFIIIVMKDGDKKTPSLAIYHL